VRESESKIFELILRNSTVHLYGGLNTYAYVGGNPISGIDPTGLADVNMIPFGEALRGAGNRVPGGQSSYYTVFGHGTASEIRNALNRSVSPSDLARIIKDDPSSRGKTIVLFACRTGGPTDNGAPNFAQQLSALTGQPVIAPVPVVWFTNGGTFLGAHPQLGPFNWPNGSGPGQWRLFGP
jgi:hypothetical protein